MDQYHSLLSDVIANGDFRMDRTNTGAYSVFGRQVRFDLSKGFPLLTTKKLHLKSIIYELLWFIRGDTNARWLQERGVRIWDDWRRPYGRYRSIVAVEPRAAVETTPFTGDITQIGVSTLSEIERKLADTWQRMMRRCYDTTHEKYGMYGGAGATVAPEWHDMLRFIADAQKLPHWWYKQRDWSNFDLDKDYYGAGQYGPNTSVWLAHAENTMYTKAAAPFVVTDGAGKRQTFLSLSHGAAAIGMSRSSIHRALDGGNAKPKANNKRFLNWNFERITPGELVRLEIIEDGDIGPIYGEQWRAWPDHNPRVDSEGQVTFGTIDQLTELIEGIKKDPFGRRHIMTAWNPADLPNMGLSPCHCLVQFFVSSSGRLSCQLYQRSADIFLGVPFNIASYALLTMMIAQVCDLQVGEFVHTFGDLHLYQNHMNQAQLQLTRELRPLPTMRLNPEVKSIFDFVFEDFVLEGYDPHPSIKADVAV